MFVCDVFHARIHWTKGKTQNSCVATVSRVWIFWMGLICWAGTTGECQLGWWPSLAGGRDYRRLQMLWHVLCQHVRWSIGWGTQLWKAKNPVVFYWIDILASNLPVSLSWAGFRVTCHRPQSWVTLATELLQTRWFDQGSCVYLCLVCFMSWRTRRLLHEYDLLVNVLSQCTSFCCVFTVQMDFSQHALQSAPCILQSALHSAFYTAFYIYSAFCTEHSAFSTLRTCE